MASSIVKSAAQQLGNLLVEEAKYLYKVRGKIESLQTELEWMECFLRDADNQQHQEKVICKFVSQLRDLAYDAEDIIERYLHEVSHHRQVGIRNTLKWFSCILSTCDAWTLHNLGSNIDDLTIQISELTCRLQRYGIQIIKPDRNLEYNSMNVREGRRTYSHIEENVVGLKNDTDVLVDQLVNQDVIKVVSVSGIGGLGKTTLTRKVFSHKDIRVKFEKFVWVYVSKEFETSQVFREIFTGLRKQARENVTNLGVEELARQIDDLLRKERCLVVLDDIWTVDAWKRLEPAFTSIKASPRSPSKILLTTRKRDLLQHVVLDEYQYHHPLKTLNLEDSWELFQQKVFLKPGNTDQMTGEMESLGKEILKQCGGLPMAIVALGGILSNKKTVAEWKDVQKNVASYLMTGVEQGGDQSCKLLEVLELSYSDLPFYLKPCFLHLANFPEDYTISTKRLYQLWEAEGFLVIEGEAKKQGGTAYDIGERYLNELVQRSMVQPGECWRASGRLRTCQVHDVMRDMCLRKYEEVSFINLVNWNKPDMEETMLARACVGNKRMRRCALHEKDESDDIHYTVEHGEKDARASLRSLLVFPLNEIDMKLPKKIRKVFPLLRVLDLQGAGLDSVDGVEHLIHLRYLSLKKTKVTKLSSCFYDLKCLETLDLRRRSSGEMILYNKFLKMKRLRHLYLPYEFAVEGAERLSFPVSQMETLENFHPEKCETKEELQMQNIRVFSVVSDYCFEDKNVLENFLGSLKMNKSQGQVINCFHLRIKANALLNAKPASSNSLEGHQPKFNKLELDGEPSKSKLESNLWWKIIFPESLAEVYVYDCEIGEEGLLALEKLPRLKYLQVGGPIVQGNKMSFSADSFPELIQLRLGWLGGLEEWLVGHGALRNLQLLELWGCRKLKKIPDGLPDFVSIVCDCSKGIENYNTCPHFNPQATS